MRLSDWQPLEDALLILLRHTEGQHFFNVQISPGSSHVLISYSLNYKSLRGEREFGSIEAALTWVNTIKDLVHES